MFTNAIGRQQVKRQRSRVSEGKGQDASGVTGRIEHSPLGKYREKVVIVTWGTRLNENCTMRQESTAPKVEKRGWRPEETSRRLTAPGKGPQVAGGAVYKRPSPMQKRKGLKQCWV